MISLLSFFFKKKISNIQPENNISIFDVFLDGKFAYNLFLNIQDSRQPIERDNIVTKNESN